MDKQIVEVIGRVVVKPKLEKSKSDKEYSKIRLAVNSKRKNEKDKTEEVVTYYDTLLFGKRAELSEKLEKGSLIRVKGDLDVGSYLTKKKEPKAALTVFIDEFHVFDTKIFK